MRSMLYVVAVVGLLVAGCDRSAQVGGLSDQEKTAAAAAGITEQELLAYKGEVRATAKGMGMTDAEADAHVRENATAEKLAAAKDLARRAVEAAER